MKTRDNILTAAVGMNEVTKKSAYLLEYSGSFDLLGEKRGETPSI